MLPSVEAYLRAAEAPRREGREGKAGAVGWSGSFPLAPAQILRETLEPITVFHFQLLGTHKKAGD